MSRHFRSLPHSNVAALGEFGSFNISGITLARTCLKAPIVSSIMCAYHIKWRALCSICITIAGITSYGQVHKMLFLGQSLTTLTFTEIRSTYNNDLILLKRAFKNYSACKGIRVSQMLSSQSDDHEFGYYNLFPEPKVV